MTIDNQKREIGKFRVYKFTDFIIMCNWQVTFDVLESTIEHYT